MMTANALKILRVILGIIFIGIVLLMLFWRVCCYTPPQNLVTSKVMLIQWETIITGEVKDIRYGSTVNYDIITLTFEDGTVLPLRGRIEGFSDDYYKKLKIGQTITVKRKPLSNHFKTGHLWLWRIIIAD